MQRHSQPLTCGTIETTKHRLLPYRPAESILTNVHWVRQSYLHRDFAETAVMSNQDAKPLGMDHVTYRPPMAPLS